MAEYRYVAADLLTGDKREDLPVISCTYADELNGAGGFSATLPLEVVDQLGYQKVTRAVLDPARTLLCVYRNGRLVWLGILWSVAVDADGNKISVAGKGVWSYLQRREIDVTTTYAATEQLAIAEDLVEDHLESWTSWSPLVVGAYAASGVTRDRTYYADERKNVAEAVEQLAAVENGFDFGWVYTGEPGDAPYATMVLSYPTRGRRTALAFETQKNIRVLNWTLDGWEMANRWSALGAGEGSGKLIAVQADPSLLTSYPRLDGSSTYSDVSIFDTLAQHSLLDLNHRKRGVETLQVEVLPDDVDAAVGSFITGDQIRVRASKGYLDLDDYYRVMTWGVSVDNQGREALQVEMAPAEAS